MRIHSTFLRAFLIAFLMGFFVSLVFAKGAPVSVQIAKDFKNFIIQGERPEIAACMAASVSEMRRNKSFKNLDWLEASSERALMHEREINNHLEREISIKVQAILNNSSFLDTWVDVLIICKQVDQGHPIVTIKKMD